MAALTAIRRFASLTNRERCLVARACVSLVLVDIALRLFGFRRFVGQPSGRETTRSVRATDLQRAREYAHWIDLAARHHWVHAQCLHRSLVLDWWLRRERLSSNLRIGVLRDGTGVLGHAWVELAGQVVGDHATTVATFTPLFTSNTTTRHVLEPSPRTMISPDARKAYSS